jgi:ATP-dependent Zn protease
MRGSSLGHHMSREKEERFGQFQGELFARVVAILGAMAAERVFYSENTTGVGGDVHSVTALAATMAGQWGMGPNAFELEPLEGETPDDARQRVLERFERIGLQIMNRTSTGPSMMGENPVGSALGDPAKRRVAAQIIGQGYVAAHNLMTHNREAVDRIAEALVERKELFGNELLDLLDSQGIRMPEVDLNDESAWPPPFFSVSGGGHGERPALPRGEAK